MAYYGEDYYSPHNHECKGYGWGGTNKYQTSIRFRSKPKNRTRVVVDNPNKSDKKENKEGNEVKQSALSKPLMTLSQNLKDLYISGKGCDVKFKVQDKSFSAHRSILGARTPVLSAMLTENWLESDTGVVSVEDCDPEAFEIFLIFLYSGTMENLTTENVLSVYYVADKYQNPELKQECIQSMISNLTISNICDVLCLALRHDEKVLEETASDFFKKNAKEIFNTSEWERFMAENTSKAKDLIIKYASAH